MARFLLKLFKRYIFGTQKLVVYEFQLSNSIKAREIPFQVEIARYRTEDAHLLETFVEQVEVKYLYDIMKAASQRVEKGHMLYIIKNKGDIIGFVWYYVKKHSLAGYPESVIYLKPNEVCAANAYIRPDRRGFDILNHSRVQIYNELRKMGYERVLTFVNVKNKSAINMHRKFGTVPIGVVKYFNILTIRYIHTNLESPKIVLRGGHFIRWKRLYHRLTGKDAI